MFRVLIVNKLQKVVSFYNFRVRTFRIFLFYHRYWFFRPTLPYLQLSVFDFKNHAVDKYFFLSTHFVDIKIQ